MAQTKEIETIDINPNTKATHSVIWLHGLGADGSDFVPIAAELEFPVSKSTRFVFPSAPIMPVTINNGYEMRAWFDIYDLSFKGKADEAGVARSIKIIHDLIAAENNRGIPTDHIVLAGFSQGAVIALLTGLTLSMRLAGILALSGFLPTAEKVLPLRNPANQSTSIFLAHGTSDPVVPFALGEASDAALKHAGYPVTWKTYPMAHCVCAEEIADMSTWLGQVFKSS